MNFPQKPIVSFLLLCAGVFLLSENVRADIEDTIESLAHGEGLAISRYIKIDIVPGSEALRSVREYISNEGFNRCSKDPSGKKLTVACKRGPIELLVMLQKGGNRLQVMSRINIVHLQAQFGMKLEEAKLEITKQELKKFDEQLFSFLRSRYGDAAY